MLLDLNDSDIVRHKLWVAKTNPPLADFREV